MAERRSPRQSCAARKRSLAMSGSIPGSWDAQRNNPYSEIRTTAAIGIQNHQCTLIHPPRSGLVIGIVATRGTKSWAVLGALFSSIMFAPGLSSILQFQGENNWRKRYYLSLLTFQGRHPAAGSSIYR